MNNFKFVEKTNNFKSVAIKFNKLIHSIENRLTNDLVNISVNDINNIIAEYDNINEQIDDPYPHHVRTKIKKRYKGSKKLPAILNCEEDFTNNPTYQSSSV